MGHRRQFIPGIVILAALSACRNNPSNPSASESAPERRADQKMERLRLQAYGPNGLEWELVSPVGEGYSADGKTVVKNLKVDLYSNSQKSSTVTADRGVMFSGVSPEGPNRSLNDVPVLMEPGDMFLDGHVVLVSTEGHTLTTDWAHYKKKFDLVVSTAPVELVRDDSVTRGVGLEATPDLAVVKIFKETLVIRDNNPAREN